MSQRFKDPENKDDEGGGLDFEIPKASNILEKLDAQIATREEIQREH